MLFSSTTYLFDVCFESMKKSSDPKVLVPVEPQFASIGGVISERMGMVGIGMVALLTGIRLTS